MLKKNIPFLCLTLLGVHQACAVESNPSFACGDAATRDEQEICKNIRLADLDRDIGSGFKQMLKMKPKASITKREHRTDVRTIAREQLHKRQACGAAAICILDEQVSILTYYEYAGASVHVPSDIGKYRLNYAKHHPEIMDDHLPTELGHCTKTKITTISARLGAPLQTPYTKEEMAYGVAIRYANDGGQVSYSYVEDVAASRAGDEVLLCLNSIPEDCPPGDHRGRVYSSTAITSGRSWIMPDSQHSCGGA